jgi:hypothetical protein
MIGVQEITVAKHEVDHGIAFAVRLLWISSEHIINGPAIVMPGRNLAVAIEVGIATGVGQSFQLVTLGGRNYSEIRIAVPPADLEVHANLLQPGFEPVLKVKFFVRAADTLDQRSLADRFNATGKYCEGSHAKALVMP